MKKMLTTLAILTAIATPAWPNMLPGLSTHRPSGRAA
jgi:hypothetical protein